MRLQQLLTDRLQDIIREEQEKFSIHQGMFCQHSAFFESATKIIWNDGKERTIALPKDEVEVFDLSATWLYLGKILSREPKSIGQSDSDHNELHTLIKAFCFGEKIQDGPFKDAVVDAVVSYSATPDERGRRWFPTMSMVDRAYKGIPQGSPFRRLLADMHVYHGNRQWIE